MCSGGGDGGAAQARADEQARQERIRKGNAAIEAGFKGFDEGFFQSRAKAYTDYATPQLQAQYGQKQNELAYNLSRSGLTASSEAARNAGELQRQYNLGRATIAGEGLNQANNARRDVEQNRSELIAQLNTTADSQAAAANSINRANVLTSKQGFSPIGNLFSATTGLLGNAAQAGYYDKNAPGLQAYGFNQPGRARIVR